MIVQFSVAPEQLVTALFRHLGKVLNDFAALRIDDGPKKIHRARVAGVPQRADGEVPGRPRK